jgi:hypothetical protein
MEATNVFYPIPPQLRFVGEKSTIGMRCAVIGCRESGIRRRLRLRLGDGDIAKGAGSDALKLGGWKVRATREFSDEPYRVGSILRQNAEAEHGFVIVATNPDAPAHCSSRFS